MDNDHFYPILSSLTIVEIELSAGQGPWCWTVLFVYFYRLLSDHCRSSSCRGRL